MSWNAFDDETSKNHEKSSNWRNMTKLKKKKKLIIRNCILYILNNKDYLTWKCQFCCHGNFQILDFVCIRLCYFSVNIAVISVKDVMFCFFEKQRRYYSLFIQLNKFYWLNLKFCCIHFRQFHWIRKKNNV